MIEWFDYGILDGFLSIQDPILTSIMKVFTVIGEGGAIWIALSLIFLINKSTRKLGAAMAVALIFCLLVGNVALKNLIARPRPCWRHPEVSMLIAVPKDYSFPSGHTMSSFAAAVSIFLANRKWGAVALAGGALIAVSRMYFYVHYPTDVLAGLAIGIVLAFIAKKIVDSLYAARETAGFQKKKG